MAECSYARCVQQRRNIRRELQRWTKNMVHIVGLERIAEELMGRRKWKLYQESMSRSYLQPLNNNIKTRTDQEEQHQHHKDQQHSPVPVDLLQDEQNQKQTNRDNIIQKDTLTSSTRDEDGKNAEAEVVDEKEKRNHNNNNTTAAAKEAPGADHQDQKENENEKNAHNINNNNNNNNNLLQHQQQKQQQQQQHQQQHQQQQQQQQHQQQHLDDRLKDWTPQTKCYFCVDGKLDSEHSTHGVLSPRHSDSDSSDSHSDNEVPPSLTPSAATGLLKNNHHRHYHHPHHNQHHHLHHRPQHPTVAPANMTTLESVTSMAALAAAISGGSSPGTPAPHLPFYAPSLLSQNWYLANMARSFQAERPQQAPGGGAGHHHQDQDKSSGGGGGGGVGANGAGIGGEQPLDLSKGSSSNNSTPGSHHGLLDSRMTNNVRLPSLDTKHIFKAKPRMSAVAGRRTYTEDELQAALRDIQSGKLGTRRAAVIYGIPRSTLRNKVYKLALERERESHLNTATTPVLKLEEEEAMMDDDRELSGAEEEKEVEKALQAPLCDILRFSNMELPPEALKALLQKGTGAKEGTQETWAGIEHSEVGPYIQMLLASQNLLAAQKLDGAPQMMPEFIKRIMSSAGEDKRLMLNNGDGDSSKRPSPSNSVRPSTRSESDMEAEESPSNVILKIPSFRPTSNKNGCDMFARGVVPDAGSMMVSPPVSESNSPPILPGKGMTIKDVKDVIAQSISQKFQQNLETHQQRRPMLEMDFKRGGFTPPLGGISVIKAGQDLSRPYQPPPKPHHQHSQQQQQQQQQQQNSAGNNSSGGGKGTRPKRGKYRNYDRDSLVEAVRAVQRGEMSVHRAGSYYGVPHSTLEYKVKERHLMRPRKRDPKPNPVDEKIASLKQNDIRISQEKLKQPVPGGGGGGGGPPPGVMKPPQKFPPTSPNGMKLPMFEPGMAGPLAGYNPPPFPFWPHPGFHHIPVEYGRNPSFPPNPEFFASQMMQKLQEESSRTLVQSAPPAAVTSATTAAAAAAANAPALAKSARQIAESLLDGTGSNGSFLDGIIRSSLESGVPTPNEKSPKEHQDVKNVSPENMSNKALLDQLCRNSRLTPLSKTPGNVTENNSSGDESYRKGGSPLNFAGTPNSKDGDSSPPRYDRDNSDLHTIELSNDSTASSSKNREQDQQDQQCKSISSPPARIYLKKDLANPDNLQPEMLMRFRGDVVLPDLERNGISSSEQTGLTGSASDNDAPQD